MLTLVAKLELDNAIWKVLASASDRVELKARASGTSLPGSGLVTRGNLREYTLIPYLASRQVWDQRCFSWFQASGWESDLEALPSMTSALEAETLNQHDKAEFYHER